MRFTDEMRKTSTYNNNNNNNNTGRYL